MSLLHVSVDTAASGNTVLRTGVASTVYHVINYVLVAGGTVNVKFLSAATTLCGALPFVVNSGASASGTRDAPLFSTAVGEDLILNLSGAVQISGHITIDTAAG